MKTPNESLRKARKSKHLKLENISEKIGVPVSTISGWENGASVPRGKNLKKIADFLGISEDEILKSARELPANLTRQSAPEAKTRKVPVISWVRAGLVDNFAKDYNDLEHQIEEWFETDCTDPTACALIVEGDSMEPEYLAGDRIVASPRETPRPNDLVVARLRTGGIFFKRFKLTGKNSEQVVLLSANPAHDPLTFSRDEFAYIYPVVDMRRKPRR